MATKALSASPLSTVSTPRAAPPAPRSAAGTVPLFMAVSASILINCRPVGLAASRAST